MFADGDQDPEGIRHVPRQRKNPASQTYEGLSPYPSVSRPLIQLKWAWPRVGVEGPALEKMRSPHASALDG